MALYCVLEKYRSFIDAEVLFKKHGVHPNYDVIDGIHTSSGSLGHGIGIEVHELPNLTLDSKDKIMENMVFTIEPGIYIPKKLGIRIEDSVLMDKKLDVLTKVTKDLLIV